MKKYIKTLSAIFLLYATPAWSSEPPKDALAYLKDLESTNPLPKSISYYLPLKAALKGKHTYRMFDGTLISINYDEWPDAPEAVDPDEWPDTPAFGDYEE